MSIEQFMRPAWTCTLDHTLDTVARLLWRGDPGAIAVVDASGLVVGLITKSDVNLAVGAASCSLDSIPVARVMVTDVVTCPIGTPIEEACKLMHAHRVGHLPVVDMDGRPLGILEAVDLEAWALMTDARSPTRAVAPNGRVASRNTAFTCMLAHATVVGFPDTLACGNC